MSRKILIIEDDPAVRQCYERLFRRAGYDPKLEASGAAAERNLENYRDVQAVILDYRMPGLNGLDLLRRLRSQDFYATGVLVTAIVTPEMMEEASRLGISRVFLKPVDISELLRAVEAIFLPGIPGGGGGKELLEA